MFNRKHNEWGRTLRRGVLFLCMGWAWGFCASDALQRITLEEVACSEQGPSGTLPPQNLVHEKKDPAADVGHTESSDTILVHLHAMPPRIVGDFPPKATNPTVWLVDGMHLLIASCHRLPLSVFPQAILDHIETCDRLYLESRVETLGTSPLFMWAYRAVLTAANQRLHPDGYHGAEKSRRPLGPLEPINLMTVMYAGHDAALARIDPSVVRAALMSAATVCLHWTPERALGMDATLERWFHKSGRMLEFLQTGIENILTLTTLEDLLLVDDATFRVKVELAKKGGEVPSLVQTMGLVAQAAAVFHERVGFIPPATITGPFSWAERYYMAVEVMVDPDALGAAVHEDLWDTWFARLEDLFYSQKIVDLLNEGDGLRACFMVGLDHFYHPEMGILAHLRAAGRQLQRYNPNMGTFQEDASTSAPSPA